MSDEEQLHGQCLCGAVKYSALARPFAADYCHCRMCQRSTGSGFGAWMDFEVEQLQWSGRDLLQEFVSSKSGRRGFCSQCGSTLSYRDTGHPNYCSLAISSLDNPALVQPSYHIHTDSQLPWLQISDDCKRYPAGQTAEGE